MLSVKHVENFGDTVFHIGLEGITGVDEILFGLEGFEISGLGGIDGGELGLHGFQTSHDAG